MGRELCTLVSILLLVTTMHASAADPTAKDCEAAQPSGAATLTPNSLQPQKNWQRQGKDINIVTPSQKLPANPRVAACFRWALQDRTVPGADAYAAFAPTRAVPAKVDKDTGAVTATLTVPDMLVARPISNAYAQAGQPIGVFSRNNTYPNADVRVLVYDGDTLVATTSGLIGVIDADNYCDIPGQETTTGSGIGELGEHKNWQPVGGVFDFTVTTSKIIPPDALVKVCFRWKLTRGDPGRYFDSPPPKLTDSQPRSVKLMAAVPNIPNRPSWFWSTFSDEAKDRRAEYAVLGFAVPRADARILIFDRDSSPLADVSTTVGITQLWFAMVVVIVGLSALFTVLYFACHYRLTSTYQSKPFLCLITTRKGFASLSQFQIILWTFVVLASVIYVIALSGDLIEITTGTLVLLGISGAATVVAKAKAETDDARPATVPDSVAAAEEASVARYEADQLKIAAQAASDDKRKDAQAAAEEADAKALVAEATAALADATNAAVKTRGTIGTAGDDASRRAAAQAAQAADELVLQKKKDLAVASARAAKLNRVRHPRWSDLVMEETLGREIDVTRVQMLCFTAVSAVFVLLSVITNYQIPDIPQGYLILMGISNSVYVGSKYAAKT